MCYNCGCGLPDDDMGLGSAGVDPDGKSITNATFKIAGDSQGQSMKEAMRNTLVLLKKVLGDK